MLLILDVVYNVVILGINFILVLYLIRSPTWHGFVTTLVASIAVSTIIAMMIGLHPFGMLRLICWGWLLHTPLLCLAGAVIAARKRNTKLCIAATTLGIIGTVIAVDAVLIEPRWLDVTEVSITTDRVQDEITVAIVADLQTDSIGSYESNVFDRIRRRAPDMVLFAGDYLQIHRTLRPHEAAKLRQLTSELASCIPGGLFAVGGNVDSGWVDLFPSENVSLFPQTGSVQTPQITVTGLSVPDSFNPQLEIARVDENFHIVLGHSPDYSLGVTDADLLVAGHTHGGQVCLPLIGPLLTLSQVPRSWCSGVTELTPEKHLIVSRGIGMERRDAPRVRFRCRPELIFVHIRPQ